MIPGLGKQNLTIGSSHSCDIILHGAGVLPGHASIVNQGGGKLLFVCGSGAATAGGKPMQPGELAPFDLRTAFTIGARVNIPLHHPAITLALMAVGTLKAPPGQIIIGRDASKASIVIQHPSVSSQHATVTLDRMMVIDHSSTSGTYVGTSRIPTGTPTPLGPSGVVAFGPVPVQVSLLLRLGDAFRGLLPAAERPRGDTPPADRHGTLGRARVPPGLIEPKASATARRGADPAPEAPLDGSDDWINVDEDIVDEPTPTPELKPRGDLRQPSRVPIARRDGPLGEANPPRPMATGGSHVAPAAMRVLVGSAGGGAEVYWDPHRPDAPLNNFGMLVTGDSGAGKTQVLMVLIADACKWRLPLCVFDFKNDYAGDFAEKHSLRVYDIDRRGLPFNPLSLLPDLHGESQPIRQVHEVVGILKRIYKLGAQQEGRLRKAIVEAYEAHGIRTDQHVAVAKVQSVPGFTQVKAILEDDPKNEALLNRLSPLFDLKLFPDEQQAMTTFDQLMGDRIVLDLHKLPDDFIKAALSEFIIVRLHGFIQKGEQPRELRRLLVFDEAWRVAKSSRLEELAREGRAFGVGIIIGTQFPGDIPKSLAGNLATQVLLLNQDAGHRAAVLRTLCGASTGVRAMELGQQLARLQKHQGYFRNQQYAPYCLVTTLPYYRRAGP